MRTEERTNRQRDRRTGPDWTGQTDKTKLTVAFRNFSNAPKSKAIRPFGISVFIFQSIRYNISEDMNS